MHYRHSFIEYNKFTGVFQPKTDPKQLNFEHIVTFKAPSSYYKKNGSNEFSPI